ncbi:TonB-dependent receptor [Sandaracinobacteroides sp. A072]|uniref:TonB-dependent receptor n=1 Tax=Sandaracinobacteroides sp. A072 TaxID=3461146 RepID=UPI004042CB6C
MKTGKIGLLLATALTGTAVNAQDGNKMAGASAFDEIIVTARKREESLQSVPLTVNVFGEQLISEANIQNMDELSDFTPGFQQQSAFGRDGDRPVIRGTSNILISEGKVGFFVDGVPFIGDTSALDLANFRRVEIIKGPQSAIYGRGTLSGAINYVSQPLAEELGGRFEMSAAEYGDYKISGRIEIPLGEGFSGFVAGKYYSLDGFFKDETTGDRLSQETISATAGLRFRSSDFEAGLTYLYTRDDDDHFAIALQDSSFNNIYTEGSRGYYKGVVKFPSRLALNTEDLINPGILRNSHRFVGTAKANLGDSGYTMSVLTGFSDISEKTGTDQTYNDQTALFIASPFVCANFVPDCNFGVSGFNTDNETKRQAISVELRLSSPAEKAFRYEVGAFFFDDRSRYTTYGRKHTELGYDKVQEGRVTTNYAAFASAEYDITSRLTVGAEIRYARDEIGTRPGTAYLLGDLFPNAAQPDRVILGDGAFRDASYTAFLPRITVNYQATDTLMIYGVFSEGNAPGGFNPLTASKTTYGEENLRNYELGIKSQPLPGLTANLSGYYIDYSDQVLSTTFTRPNGSVDSYSDNVGDTEIKGLEFEAAWRITDFLTLSGTYSFIDAEITRGSSVDQAVLLGGSTGTGLVPNPAVPGAFLPTTGGCANPETVLNPGQKLGDGTITTAPTPCATFADISGKTPPLVSKHQASFSAALDLPLGSNGLEFFARGDVVYRSSFFAQIHNLAETGDATRVNLAAGLRKDNLSLRFWVKNLFDNDTPNAILRYVDFAAPSLNGLSQRGFAVTPAMPRQFGVTLSGSF